MAHIEEKYGVLFLLVDVAEKKHTAQLNVLLTEMRLRRVMEGVLYLSADALFLFSSAFIDRGLGFLENCDLLR